MLPSSIVSVRRPATSKRDDANFTYAAAWEYTGDLAKPALHKEELKFEDVHLAVRSYK